MRTDGVQLSQEIIDGARAFVRQQYGEDYLPASPRIYKCARTLPCQQTANPRTCWTGVLPK